MLIQNESHLYDTVSFDWCEIVRKRVLFMLLFQRTSDVAAPEKSNFDVGLRAAYQSVARPPAYSLRTLHKYEMSKAQNTTRLNIYIHLGSPAY